MGEAQRFRPISPDRGALHQAHGIAAGTTDGRREDRLPRGRHGEQPVGAQQGPPPVRRTGEPLRERRTDPGELGGSAGDGHDRSTKLAVDRVEVEDVEASHDDAVDQNRPNTVERAEGADERYDPAGPVRSIDPDAPRADRLEPFGERHHDGAERRVALGPVERAIIDTDELRVGFAERPPQR